MKKVWKKIKSVIPFMLIGLGMILMFYPYISEYLFENRVDSEIIAYQKEIGHMDNQQYDQMLKQAELYNTNLQKAQVQLADPFMETNETGGQLFYENVFQLDESDIMGYIELPTIGVKLPIYQGTSPDVLERGVGHLKGSSFPVGGAGTHAVLTGHTGLSQAKLLSDLSEMKQGDRFYLSVFGRKLAYEVYSESVVLPEDTEQLRIEKNEDIVTLVTCTPYGINTHRLFVHGKRVDFNEQQYQEAIENTTDGQNSKWRSAYGKAVFCGCFAAVMLLMLLSFDVRKMVGIIMILVGGMIFFSPEMTQKYYQIRTQAALQVYDEQNNEQENKNDDIRYQRMQEYNQSLYEDNQSVMNDPWNHSEQADGMEAWSESMIGYVNVPALGQMFPIYFGATTEHMAEGIAIMKGTSMPIGGKNTNCVLAGHRGYNQNKTFFKDIENLTEGDEIDITNPWEKLQYQVEKIDIVDPDDFDAVKIQEGKDMVTLLTCHPYGSHGRYRYLVYCTRVGDGQKIADNKKVENEQHAYIVASDGKIYPSSKQDIQKEKIFRLLCAGMMLLMSVFSALSSQRRRRRVKGDKN